MFSPSATISSSVSGCIISFNDVRPMILSNNDSTISSFFLSAVAVNPLRVPQSSIVTTIMVARKILENWLYWIAIDAVSIYLYLSQDLYQTAILFVLYMILSIMGYYEWRKRYLSYI